MRILITGSEGFIGRRLVGMLRAERHIVAGLDKEEPANHDPANYVCDVLDAAALRRVLEHFAPEGVVHLAARTDLDGRTLDDYAANIEGVRNLVEAIRAAPSVRRAVWTSSQLVCRVGYVPRDPFDYRPDTLYGQSKVRTEQIVRAGDGGARDWVLVRPTTIWGPGMSSHYQRLLAMIRTGRYVHVGRTPLMKSYGYVDNTAFQYHQLLTASRELVHGRLFYLADYEPIDLRAWCDGLQHALGAPKIRTVPRAVAKALARAGDALNAVGFRSFPFNSFRLKNILTEYQFDLSATRGICGPLPFTLQRGLEETASWYAGIEHDRANG